MYGHVEICEILLEAGANANAQTDPQKYAPLHSAAFGGHVEAIKVLLLVIYLITDVSDQLTPH